MSTAVVVVAAGRGTRLAREDDRPKGLVEVAGAALVTHALARVATAAPDRIVLVHPPGWQSQFAAADPDGVVDRFVAGGETRTRSVRLGTGALPADVDVVAVHDAARPFTPPTVIRAAIAAVGGPVVAAAPAVPLADTVKRVADDEVVGTVDRADLAAVQTPQVFARVTWEAARRWAGDAFEATDDLALVEAALEAGAVSGSVRLIPGSRFGFKITYPEDLILAAALAAQLGAPA